MGNPPPEPQAKKNPFSIFVESEIEKLGENAITEEQSAFLKNVCLSFVRSLPKNSEPKDNINFVNIVSRLLLCESLTPVTEADDWKHMEGEIYQSMRDTRIFKTKDFYFQTHAHVFVDRKVGTLFVSPVFSCREITLPYYATSDCIETDDAEVPLSFQAEWCVKNPLLRKLLTGK